MPRRRLGAQGPEEEDLQQAHRAMTDTIIKQHPRRTELQSEAHARPPLELRERERDIWHWVLFDRDDASPWPDGVDPDARYQIIDRPEGRLRIEHHTEFVACTYISDAPPPPDILELLAALGGVMLTGVQIMLRSPDEAADRAPVFRGDRLFGGAVNDGRFTLATDFQVNEGGFVPYLMVGDIVDRFEAARLVKKIIDLETYRIASLMGFALAREKNERLRDLERRAADVTQSIADVSDTHLEGSIGKIAMLLGETTRLRLEVRYRFGASLAYYDIVEDRLHRLAETPVSGQGTIRTFTELRLSPAIKTMRAFASRLVTLSDDLSAAMTLIQTRLDQQVQRQNQELLKSMNQRARQQVLLGQAVEGLSVVAITYYGVGILGYLLKGIPGLPFDATALMATAIAPVAVLVWWKVRRARRKLG